MFKYIIFQRPDTLPMPIIFAKMEQHVEVAARIGLPALSAGFMTINDFGEMRCFGKSVSLKLKSEEGDSTILRSLYI